MNITINQMGASDEQIIQFDQKFDDRINTLGEKFDQKIDQFKQEFDQKIDILDQIFELKFDNFEQKLNKGSMRDSIISNWCLMRSFM